MPNSGQATLEGNVFFIECDENWDCCQRQQAQYKAKAMNKAIGNGKRMRKTAEMQGNRACPRSTNLPAAVAAKMSQYKNDVMSLNEWKGKCQSKFNDEFDKKSPKERAQDAKDAGAAPCVVEQIEKGRTRQAGNPPPPKNGLQMDHPLDCKLGGDPVCTLIPLDAEVNGLFGNRAQNIERYAEEGRIIKGVALICPAEPPPGGCKPPHDEGKGKSFNAGTAHGTSFPKNPAFVTPKP